MEIWFVSAIGGAVFAGVSNFYFKQAAARGYNAELFTLYGGIVSVVLVSAITFVEHDPLSNYGWISGLVFLGGFIAAQTNIFKVQALRFIDSTIYFPLYKLLAPTLAIMAGVILFQETFTTKEWFGMILGLLVPLLLITKAENGRQNNLLAGLILVLVTGFTSATAAVFNKYATDAAVPVLSVLLFASFGILVGSVAALIFKRGVRELVAEIKNYTTAGLFLGASLRAVFISASLGLMLYAYATGGTLAIVQTIHSMYILIPIVLAIIFYNEHWNMQKVIAITLSVGALAMLQ